MLPAELEELMAMPTEGPRLSCRVNLVDLLELYEINAQEAGVVSLPEENDISVFSTNRTKLDPGLGSSWKAMRRGGAEVEDREFGSGQRGADEQEGREVTGVEPGTDHHEEAEELMRPKGKRKRARGPGSKASRKRHGKDLKQAGSNAESRRVRLADKWISEGESFRTDTFSLIRDGPHTTTGWQGVKPPTSKRQEILQAYEDGSIVQILGKFYPIPYQQGRPAFLEDSSGATFFYRSAQSTKLLDREQEFYRELVKLLMKDMLDESIQNKSASGERGVHLANMLGHYRQYTVAPTLTSWHKENRVTADAFISSPLIEMISKWVSSQVDYFFPGVAHRFRNSAAWHERKHGIKPFFGLFWNMCANAAFPGQKRVHCKPHTDHKNIVGVCAVFVYEIPGAKFNHSQRSWLVLWEAGVIVELPPWVVAIFPSSLFYHFNIDITDIKFVTTEGNERPTPFNSKPIEDGDDEGRGSLVYFNEATMYQSSETDSATIEQAKEKGHSGKTDYGEDVRKGFQQNVIRRRLV